MVKSRKWTDWKGTVHILPFGEIAPNGMTFKNSVSNPNSRLSRLVNYLRKNGPTTKEVILRDVFGKTMGKGVTRGWGAYLFQYGRKVGFISYTRSGKSGVWSVGPEEHLVTK
jgi:hypothetical protein